MSLSGLAIFKLLPGGKKTEKANCKECGYTTCMAYAMKLAKGEASVDDCKYISEELKSLIESQSTKSQHEIKFGIKGNPLTLGGETVLYRHEKTFINPTILSIRLKTSTSLDKNIEMIEKITSYKAERVGETFSIDSITIENDTEDTSTYHELLECIKNKEIDKKISLILISKNKNDLIKASELLNEEQSPLLFLKNTSTEGLLDLSHSTQNPIIVEATSLETLLNTIKKLETEKVTNLVLSIPEDCQRNIIETLTLFRRNVFEGGLKELRYPVITFAGEYFTEADALDEGLFAGNFLCKYANMVVLDHFNPAVMYALLTLRQNLYTDPQKPLQIEPKLYEIGDVTDESPVIITTNFALTYFMVSGEIESTNIPSYLLVTPSDGMSVLTAWAANKFSGEIIAKSIRESGLEEKICHKQLIIPGYVSSLKEEIEEELPDWQVFIAPLEAVDIPTFLQKHMASCKQAG